MERWTQVCCPNIWEAQEFLDLYDSEDDDGVPNFTPAAPFELYDSEDADGLTNPDTTQRARSNSIMSWASPNSNTHMFDPFTHDSFAAFEPGAEAATDSSFGLLFPEFNIASLFSPKLGTIVTEASEKVGLNEEFSKISAFLHRTPVYNLPKVTQYISDNFTLGKLSFRYGELEWDDSEDLIEDNAKNVSFSPPAFPSTSTSTHTPENATQSPAKLIQKVARQFMFWGRRDAVLVSCFFGVLVAAVAAELFDVTIGMEIVIGAALVVLLLSLMWENSKATNHMALIRSNLRTSMYDLLFTSASQAIDRATTSETDIDTKEEQPVEALAEATVCRKCPVLFQLTERLQEIVQSQAIELKEAKANAEAVRVSLQAPFPCTRP